MRFCTCAHCRARQPVLALRLSVPEQRKMVEAQCRGPCFRMWMSDKEFERSVQHQQDWTAYPLMPGYMAIWRKRSDVDILLASTETRALGLLIQSRELPDVGGPFEVNPPLVAAG